MPSVMPPTSALIASSYRSFLSKTSASVEPPTLILATAPRSFVMRCSSRWISNSLFALPKSSSICPLSTCTASSTAASCVPSDTSSVFFWPTTARETLPRSASVAFSSLSPSSPVMRVAPVKVQMSCRNPRFTSPNPGALMAQEVSTPRCRLRMRPDSASVCTSAAMIKSGDFSSTTFSRTPSTSDICVIFWSVTNTRASGSTDSRVSISLISKSLTQPHSISMPSENSTTSVNSCPSSTVVEPSIPTLSMASASNPPISQSLHEMPAICWYCSRVVTGTAASRIFCTKNGAALSRPLRRAIEFAPEATYLTPRCIIACVSTVAVVVPSPARASVRDAACRSRLTPMFSMEFETSTSRAIVTPSLTTRVP
mmetsp:Transcript_24613/g.53082  ORF Transcript_24613/g.53082 Transcript_24613/m.53082 type:complete len:370 (-) Transcript_24613:294-1403(-)